MRPRSFCLWLTGAVVLARPIALLAQNDNGNAAAASGAAGCLACSGGLIVLMIAWIALVIALLVWVARDAKARGLDSSILWMLLVMGFGPIGLVIYLLARPRGDLIPCPNCGNKRLQISVKCPHCSIGS